MAKKVGLDLVIGLVDDATRGLEGIQGKISTLGKVAGGIALAGIGALGAGLFDATKEAAAAQEVMTETEAILKSTGGVSGMTAG